MRGTMSEALTGTLVATVLAAGTAGASPAPPRPETRQVVAAAELPEEVVGGVVVDLGDGDRYKVWHSADLRTVWGQRYDAATGTWGTRTVVLREDGLECEEVDARASAGAVAVIVRCYTHEGNGDQVAHALYSADTVAWAAHRLDGLANDPGISPDGRTAVWSLREGYVTWTATEGFVGRSVEVEGETYNATATVADDGTVSFLYPVDDPGGVNCRVEVVTRLADGPVAGQTLVPERCFLLDDLDNVDALTVHFGSGYAAYQSIISRPDTASGWAVTSPAPIDAPGLVLHEGRTHTRFLEPPGFPLVALGSGDHQTFEVQEYDEVAQRWGAPRLAVRTARRCRWDELSTADHLAVMVAGLRCRRSRRVLVSADAAAWSDLALRRPLGFSADGQWVSASTRRTTTVFSREQGRVRLPLGAPRPCDVVIPASPSSAVRLTTSRPSGWPTVLQRSSASRWRRTDTAVPRAPAGGDTCTTVASYAPAGALPAYVFNGQRQGLVLTVVPRGDGWAVRRSTY